MLIFRLAALLLSMAGPLLVAAEWSFYCHDGGFKLQHESSATECTLFYNTCTKTKGRSKPKTLKKGHNLHYRTNSGMELVLYKDKNCTEPVQRANEEVWKHMLEQSVRSWRVRHSAYRDHDEFPTLYEPRPGC